MCPDNGRKRVRKAVFQQNRLACTRVRHVMPQIEPVVTRDLQRAERIFRKLHLNAGLEQRSLLSYVMQQRQQTAEPQCGVLAELLLQPLPDGARQPSAAQIFHHARSVLCVHPVRQIPQTVLRVGLCHGAAGGCSKGFHRAIPPDSRIFITCSV